MKKVALGYAFSGENIGGVRRYIENIEKLSNHKITLFPNYENDNKWKENFDNKIRNKLNKEIIKKQQEIIDNYDIFHSNVDPNWINLCNEAKKQGKIWIHTYHNIYMKEDEPNNKLQNWQKNTNDALLNIAKNANYKICVNEWLVKELKEKNIESVFIPNFIDTELLDNVIRNTFKTKYNIDNYILFVGDISIRKNCIEFIKLAQKLPFYKFVMIGNKLTSKEIENTYNILIPTNIFTLGSFNYNDCLEAICDCKMLIICSFTEGLPTVLIEGMYFEKPCIIPKNQKWSETLLNEEELGHKYSMGNLEELSKIIIDIQNNYKNMTKAKEYIENNFSSKNIINKIDKIYLL